LTDTGGKVFIKRRTKLHILWLFLVTEQTLSRLVETLSDMFEGVRSTVFGTSKLIFEEGTGSPANEHRSSKDAIRRGDFFHNEWRGSPYRIGTDI
jgi:hypothetical protein